MRHAEMAAIETDMACVATAAMALGDLEVLAIRALQAGLLDVGDAERMFGALGRVRTGLGVGRKWLATLRSGG